LPPDLGACAVRRWRPHCFGGNWQQMSVAK
jgi:hypothetical protein